MPSAFASIWSKVSLRYFPKFNAPVPLVGFGDARIVQNEVDRLAVGAAVPDGIVAGRPFRVEHRKGCCCRLGDHASSGAALCDSLKVFGVAGIAAGGSGEDKIEAIREAGLGQKRPLPRRSSAPAAAVSPTCPAGQWEHLCCRRTIARQDLVDQNAPVDSQRKRPRVS